MWANVHDAGRLLVAVTLLVAGASKLLSPRPLSRSLGQTFGWGRGAGILVARAVALVELAAALLVASGWVATVGLGLTGLVGLGIIAFVAIAMSRGTNAPCGCFGEADGRPIGVRNLLAGAGLVAGAGGLLALGPAVPAAELADAELVLPLIAALAMVSVMVRDRSRLLSPFFRHFRPFPAGPLPSEPDATG